MSTNRVDAPEHTALWQRVLYILSFLLVVVGLFNSIPNIPGLDDWAQRIAGSQSFAIRKYPFEYFYPLFFVAMMMVVVLKHSVYRAAAGRSRARRLFGAALTRHWSWLPSASA